MMTFYLRWGASRGKKAQLSVIQVWTLGLFCNTRIYPMWIIFEVMNRFVSSTVIQTNKQTNTGGRMANEQYRYVDDRSATAEWERKRDHESRNDLS